MTKPSRTPASWRVGLLPPADAAAWDHFVAAQPGGHLLQSWGWGAFKHAQGWNPARLAVHDRDGALQATAGVLFRRPARGVPVAVAYVPRGPVMAFDEAQPPAVALLAGLHNLCRRRGAILLKIEPNCEADPRLARMLAAAGFRPARRVQPVRTILLDLQPAAPEDVLLAAMKPKTRYNIRLAGRRGVTVRPATTPADLQAFYDLMTVTGTRDEFAVHSLDYYQSALAQFGPSLPLPLQGRGPGDEVAPHLPLSLQGRGPGDEVAPHLPLSLQGRGPGDEVAPHLPLSLQGRGSGGGGGPLATLLLAQHPDHPQPLAGLMAFAFGAEAIYMYGASSDAGREHMPTYLLQWEAMRWARTQGCRRYDFWGIPDDPTAEAPAAGDNPNVRQGLWGVYRFKQGFGGREVTYPGAWDFVYRPLAYRLYERLLAARQAG